VRITSVKSDEERQILTALIVHNEVLSTLCSKLGQEREPFENKWANVVYGWCRQYHEKYNKAPRRHIQQLFAKYAAKSKDEDSVALMESFLSRLSKDYEGLKHETNEQFVLDTAAQYFDRVRLQRIQESMSLALENRDVVEAKKAHAGFQPMDFSAGEWKDPLDEDTIRQTLRRAQEEESLIEWHGEALNRFLGPQFGRGKFVSFVAPEKRGKSFWLLETVYQAVRQRRKVLYYVIGDMSEDQANLRFYGRVTRKPYAGDADVRIPKAIDKTKEGMVVRYKEERRTKPTVQDVLKARERLKQATAVKVLPLKTRCVAAGVVSASNVEQDIAKFAADGWAPDVVVLDYADLLAPEPGSGQEFRHQVNETWKVLRRISLDYHCCVVTATQAAASSYDAEVIKKKDFSEDKRKNAHVTGMVGINQNTEEKEKGLYRLNWIFLRDGKWSDGAVVWTAGELAVACPCLLSRF
jgi:hypothetical protein